MRFCSFGVLLLTAVAQSLAVTMVGFSASKNSRAIVSEHFSGRMRVLG
jgi:hypothetical protein